MARNFDQREFIFVSSEKHCTVKNREIKKGSGGNAYMEG